MKKLLRTFKKFLLGDPGMRAIPYQGLWLPPFRTNQDLDSSEAYVDSAHQQITHLQEYFNFNDTVSLLDFGCGQGRFANGLLHGKWPVKRYTGVDTHAKSVKWCQRWIGRNHAKFQFIHLPAENARYNAAVSGLKRLPFEDSSFDLIFLNSVFSHMLTADVQFYLQEFYKVLKPNGIVYLTAFIEEDVPAMEENPENYIDLSTGHLHRVRFEKEFFFGLVGQARFKVAGFHHQHIQRTKQSVVILRKSVT